MSAEYNVRWPKSKSSDPLMVIELAMALKAVLSGDDTEMSYDYAENVLEKFTKIYGEVPDLNTRF